MLLIESINPWCFKQALPYRALENIMDVVQERHNRAYRSLGEHYDPDRGVAFNLFSVHRIRGRMLNFLRKRAIDIACMDAAAIDGGMTLKENLMDMSPSVAEQAEDHELILPGSNRRWSDCP